MINYLIKINSHSNNTNVTISPQQLTSCANSTFGASSCNGGNLSWAYWYANSGVTNATNYPFSNASYLNANAVNIYILS